MENDKYSEEKIVGDPKNNGIFDFENAPVTEAADEPKPMPFFKRLGAIFFAPVRLMENIADCPHFFSPIMYIILLSIPSALMATSFAVVSTRAQMDFMFEQYGILMPDASQVLQTGSLNYISMIISFVAQPITVIIGCAFSALVLFIASKIFRGKVKYKQLFSMSLHIAVIDGIGLLLYYGLSITLQSPLNFTSLAPLFMTGQNPTSIAYYVFSSISIFGIWSLVLQCIGVKALNNFSYKKAVAIVLILFALGILFSAGMAIGMRVYYDWYAGILKAR